MRGFQGLGWSGRRNGKSRRPGVLTEVLFGEVGKFEKEMTNFMLCIFYDD